MILIPGSMVHVFWHGCPNQTRPPKFPNHQTKPITMTAKIPPPRFKVIHYDPVENYLMFDLIGVDASFANALRRIMMAEVEVMAIDRVVISANDTPIADEVLANRLGLIPIRADALKFKEWDSQLGMAPRVDNCIKYELNVVARKKDVAPRDGTVHVLSKELKRVPMDMSEEEELETTETEVDLAGEGDLVFDDIMLAKMNPGMRLQATCYAKRGTGAIHTKWSPVSCASYRMMPSIEFTSSIEGESAEELKRICPQDVYDVEDSHAFVKDLRSCTMCMECTRIGSAKDKILLRRSEDVFVFTVEGVGQLDVRQVVTRAIDVLQTKCERVEAALDVALAGA